MKDEVVGIRDVEIGSLRDIRNIKIDSTLPKEKRIKEFVSQIGNPYCYRDGDIVVKISFSDTDVTLEDRLSSYYENLG